MKKIVNLMLLGLTMIALAACDNEDEFSLNFNKTVSLNGLKAEVHYTLTDKNKPGSTVEIPVAFSGKATQAAELKVELTSKQTGINVSKTLQVNAGEEVKVTGFNLSFTMPKEKPRDLDFFFTVNPLVE
ncbi:MAG: RagB/SusD family nutrient uptake outer membrane protein [Mediterranea sp.]|jgi:hypothetical protein|nr:RagB/SusD family nutrient uptake outer membrane protein [Mediterranea sp.]